MGAPHFTPIYLTEGTTLAAMQAFSWKKNPAALWATGTVADGTRVLITSTERQLDTTMPSTRQGMETVHLQRFRSDCQARGEGDPIERVTFNASDPPDFHVWLKDATSSSGLECTRLADEALLRAHGQVSQVRRSVLAKGRRSFRHLQGTVAYVGFDTFDDVAGGPSGKMGEVVQSVVAMLEGLAPLRGNHPVLKAGDAAPDIQLEKDSFGSTVHAASLEDGHEPSRFMHSVGFEIAIIYNHTYRMDEVWDDLEERIKRKDKEGNDWVLISAGGPDRQGTIYPLESALVSFAAEDPRNLSLSNTKRVSLHSWASGEAWNLYPKFERLARPIEAARLLGTPEVQISINDEFVAIPETLTAARNAPCPCGSGDNFKRCHGRSW